MEKESNAQNGDITENTRRDRIRKLKLEKSKAKSSFTRARRQLLTLIDSNQEEFRRSDLLEASEKLEFAQVTAMDILTSLSEEYMAIQEDDSVDQICIEMEKLESEFTSSQNDLEAYMRDRRREHSTTGSVVSASASSTKYRKQAIERLQEDQRSLSEESNRSEKEEDVVNKQQDMVAKQKGKAGDSDEVEGVPGGQQGKRSIEQDMWRQLKRVAIPVFSGEIKGYKNWKAAFVACIDKAPATPEYKLLQLRQYLSGEALKAVEGLGHSAAAYEAAKDRLDRKYGGKRRQIGVQLEEIQNFRPIRPGNYKDMDSFADLLDIAMINLKDSGLSGELDSQLLYSVLLRKMTEGMVSQYKRWARENTKVESVEVLREWIIREAEYRTSAHEAVKGIGEPKELSSDKRGTKGKSYFAANKQKRNSCVVCGQTHPIWSCPMFKSFTTKRKWETAKKLDLCFRCLGNGHQGSKCPRTQECSIDGCTKNHHKLLHQARDDKQQEDEMRMQARLNALLDCPTEGERQPLREDSAKTFHSDKLSCEKVIALRTVPVILQYRNRSVKINALLDDGSTATYLNTSIASELGLKGQKEQASVQVLNGQGKLFQTMPVECRLKSIDGAIDVNIFARTLDSVTGDLQVVDWKKCCSQWPHLTGIKFPSYGKKVHVDMLIGLDHSDLHRSIQEVCGKEGEPVARLTPLGWTCVGTAYEQAPDKDWCHVSLAQTYVSREIKLLEEINCTLRKFWDTETLGTRDTVALNFSEQQAMDIATKSLIETDSGYQIGIPWKIKQPQMPINYSYALKRLEATEKKLRKDVKIAEAYSSTIQQYVEKGYVRKVKPEESIQSTWYLPHFPVVREDKSTTKTRIVFDASAKFKGVCLNDTIHQGPKLQQDLFHVLLRFRKNPVAIICDIAEMYLRVQMAPEGRCYHRFLWRDLVGNKAPEIYEFQRLVFGVNASPFLAQYVAQENARKHSLQFPMAAETVLKSTYMDDSMDSVRNDKEGCQLFQQLSQLWGKAGMHARKWLSNSEAVLQHIPQEDRAGAIDLEEGELPSVKTLGVLWVTKEDNFTFKASPPNDEFCCTKRNVLRKIATIFDPLGFLSAYIIRGKILMQEIWSAGFDWDDRITGQLRDRVMQWFSELVGLQEIKVPRCLRLDQHEEVVDTSLHTFVDASQDAYGAVTYLRTEYRSGQVATRFVASKAKVSPLSSTSIPRLELMAGVMGLRLTKSVTAAIGLAMQDVTLSSDSMNVLWWIRGQSKKYKPFVANRVGEIHEGSQPAQWRYVPTKTNPADLASRGETVTELSKSDLWWCGPEFLKQHESTWPTKTPECSQSCIDEMKGGNHVFLAAEMNHQTPNQTWRLTPERFSNFRKLVHTTAWVKRFISNCKYAKYYKKAGELTPEEIKAATMFHIKNAQFKAFPEEYKALQKQKELPSSSKLLSLHPRVDDEGTMRCDGRLRNAEFLSYNARYPIILPRKSWVTKLIVRRVHEDGKHVAGVNHTLATLSTSYWIPAAREEIKEVEKECAQCKRQKAKAAVQIMAPLPKARVQLPLRAFAKTAVDFAGPFLTRQGRGKSKQKRYLCLFTCLASRAVHLEVAYGLDTDSFLKCFHRFINRRNLPLEMFSDNGSNFVKADKELRNLIDGMSKSKITNDSSSRGVKWNFNPPLAPHFGGAHEAMIKAAKRAIYAILGKADVTDEELQTAFTGAESLINSRPITYQSSNPADDVPLTPNHFLVGQAGGQFGPEVVDSTAFHPSRRWRYVQELIKHFWRRWLREWLPGLNNRSKWRKVMPDLKVDDIVLVIDPDTTRGRWPLGRIIETFPGVDGHVRVVRVQVGDSVFTRAISRLCPLECD